MLQHHTNNSALSDVELSWVNTLIDYVEVAPVSPSTHDTPLVPSTPSNTDKVQRRKLLNRKSAREARIRRGLYIESLQAKIQELERHRQALLAQVEVYTEENLILKESILDTLVDDT